MRYESRVLALCRLPQDTAVAGYPFPASSTLWFSEQGALAQARLGREAPVLGLPLPEGTQLFFRPDGSLRFFWLPRDTRLQGHLVRAQDDGQGNRLHPNGALRAIWLAEDETIDGVPCSSSGSVWRLGWRVIGLGTRRMAWFHDNGRLQQAMLGRDSVIQGRAMKAGEVVRLDAQGRLEVSPTAFDE